MNPKSETSVFCHKYKACPEGRKFASRYATMADCYEALLAGCAGRPSADWAAWAYTRGGVVTHRKLCKFAAFCVAHVKRHIKECSGPISPWYIGEFGSCCILLDALQENNISNESSVYTIAYVTRSLTWWEDDGYAKWQLEYLNKQKNPFKKCKFERKMK